MDTNNTTFTVHIAICDDDPVMLERLQALAVSTLADTYHVCVHRANSAGELLSMEQIFHLVVLDIQLPQSSGIELARTLLARDPRCRVLFVSGYVSFVSEVYEVPHLCLVLKEQLDAQLPKFLHRAAAAAATEAGRVLTLRSASLVQSVPLSSVSVMERRGHWTYLTLEDGSQLQTREKLHELLQRMASPDFCRCHISYCVNLRHAEGLRGRELSMRGGHRIPISRPNERTVRDAWFRFLGDNT